MPAPSYLKFIPRVFFKRSVLPHYLVFFVTKNCTAKCKHCLLGDRAVSHDEFTLDEIEKMTYTMDPLLFLLITGGDPFLRDDVVDIVKLFYKYPGFRNLGMPSNGFLSDKIVPAVEQILRDCKGIDFAVDISIDAVGGDHDRIRGVPGLFDRAVDTYKNLKKLQDRYRNFNLNVAVTVSHFNYKTLDRLYEFLKNELGVVNINHLLCRGDPRDPEALDVDMDYYVRFSKQLDDDIKKRLLSGYSGYPFANVINAMKLVRQRLIHKIATQKRFFTPCYAGRLGVILYPDGTLAPCELRTEVMGNLREKSYDFRSIMESDRAEFVRQTIDKEKCYCTYECFLTNAVIFNPI
ncbi:radical SAM protein, partial [bacterium]|nr:radical SAM protein [candidate division CSSED10-310 bacterium]